MTSIFLPAEGNRYHYGKWNNRYVECNWDIINGKQYWQQVTLLNSFDKTGSDMGISHGEM